MLRAFNIITNTQKRTQAIEELRILILNSETSVDLLMDALYKLYPLPEIQSIYSASSGNKAIFIHHLLNFVQFRTVSNHPADPYLDIISLRKTINTEVERNLQISQESSLRQQEMYHANQNFILKYHRKEHVRHERVIEIAADIHAFLQDANISERYKIRNIMRNGSRLLLIKILLKFDRNPLLQPTDQDTVYCNRLHSILDSIQVEIQNTMNQHEIIAQQDFGNFAELAIELEEIQLLAECIKFGATLYDDVYFIRQAEICRQNGNLDFAALLDQMTTDPEMHKKKFLIAIQELDYNKFNELSLSHPTLINEHFAKTSSKLSELQKLKVHSKAKFTTTPEPFEKFIKNINIQTEHLCALINNQELHVRLKRIVLARISNLNTTELLKNADKLDLEALALYLDPTNDEDERIAGRIKKAQISLQDLANKALERFFINSSSHEMTDEVKVIFCAANKQILFYMFKHLIFSDLCKDTKRFSEILLLYKAHATRKGFELKNLMNNEGHDLLCESLDALSFEKMAVLLNHDFPLKRDYKINNMEASITQMIILLLRTAPILIEPALTAIKVIAQKSPCDMHHTPHNDINTLSVIQYALMIPSNKKNATHLRALIGILLKSCPDQNFGLNGENIFHYIGLYSNPSCLAEVCEYLSQTHDSSKIHAMLISKNKNNMSPIDCARNHADKEKQAQMAGLISEYINIFASGNQNLEARLKMTHDNSPNIVATYSTAEQFNALMIDNPEHSHLIVKHLHSKMLRQNTLENEASWIDFIENMELPIKYYKVFLHQSEISHRIKPYLLARLLDGVNFAIYPELNQLDLEIDLVSTAKSIFSNINVDTREQLELIINIVTTVRKYCTLNRSSEHANNLYKWSTSGANNIPELEKILASLTYDVTSNEPNALALSDFVTMYLVDRDETFLHHIIENHNEEIFLNCLNHITKFEYPGMTETILFTMNSKGKNLYSMLECKPDYWKDSSDRIANIMADYIASKIKRGHNIYKILPYKINFYAMYETNIIEQLLLNSDYSRLLNILEGRLTLAWKIKQQTSNLVKNFGPDLKSAFDNVNIIFGVNYLLEFKVNKMSLMNYIIQEFNNTEHSNIKSQALKQIIESQVFRSTIATSSVLCIPQWYKLMKALELKKDGKSLNDQLEKLKQQVKIFNMDINTPNNIATPLRQAILYNSLAVIKFLCEQINAIVISDTMLWSLTFANNTTIEILEYLTKRYNLQIQFSGDQTASRRLISEHSASIMLHTIKMKDAASKLNWLIDAGCNVEATYSNGENVVQKLISLAYEEEDLLDVDNIIIRMRAILNNPETKKRLLSHHDNNGKTVSDYISRLPCYCDPKKVIFLKNLLGINSINTKVMHKPKF